MTEELGEDPSEDRPGGRTPEESDEHLQDLPDGSGCTEIWEHLAEGRADDD